MMLAMLGVAMAAVMTNDGVHEVTALGANIEMDGTFSRALDGSLADFCFRRQHNHDC